MRGVHRFRVERVHPVEKLIFVRDPCALRAPAVQGQPANSHAVAGAIGKTKMARDRPGRIRAAPLCAPQVSAEAVRQSPPRLPHADPPAQRAGHATDDTRGDAGEMVSDPDGPTGSRDPNCVRNKGTSPASRSPACEGPRLAAKPECAPN